MAGTPRQHAQVQLGAGLKKYRQAAGISLEDAATQVDTTPRDLIDWEECLRCPDKPGDLFVLGELYSLTLDKVQPLFEQYEQCLRESASNLAGPQRPYTLLGSWPTAPQIAS
jgi:hypothetical protein